MANLDITNAEERAYTMSATQLRSAIRKAGSVWVYTLLADGVTTYVRVVKDSLLHDGVLAAEAEYTAHKHGTSLYIN